MLRLPGFGSSNPLRWFSRGVGLTALLLLAAIVPAGCSSESASSAPAPSGGKSANIDENDAANDGAGETASTVPALDGPVTASGVLEMMVKVYRQARSYADAGQIEVRGVVGEQKIDENAPCSVTFERPNRLRLHAYQANLLSDGRQLRGWIDTSNPGDPFAGQVLTLEAPAKLSLENVYADEVLGGYLTQGIAGGSLPLLLLLGDDPLQEIQADGERPVLLEPEAIDKKMCHRVLLARAEGKLVLWIDRGAYLLRRIEIPNDQLRQQLAQSGEVKSLSVQVEFAGVQINGKPDETAFQFEAPSTAKIVKEFDRRELMPPPIAPSPFLGKPAPDFSLTDLAGKPIDKDSLSGKIAVLDFWFTGCQPCRQTLPLMEQVYQKYRDNELVRFVAVSVDAAEVGNDKLQDVFKELKVTIPIARDSALKLGQGLGVAGFPTTVILGADGTVQDLETGANPQLVVTLPAKLDRLIKGEEIYTQVLKEYQRRLAEHEQSLKEPEIQKATIAEATQPKRLKISKLWSSPDVQQPGNITVAIDAGRPPRVLVNEGWKNVAELGLDGTLVKKHDLKLAEEDVIGTLRTAVGRDSKRYFLGLASSQKQVHVFDASFQRVSSYPPDREHASIADALLTDLDNDGTLEVAVSYWGVVGVQAATLEGKRLWTNRTMEHVFRLAMTGADPQGRSLLLCAHGQGTLVPLSPLGQEGKPIAVGTHFLRSVYSADLLGDGQPKYLGLASTNLGGDSAVGLSLDGKELWSHALPKGVQEHPALEMVTFGSLSGTEGQWIIAGADGSIHILSAEGELIDQFNYGAAISGLAAATDPSNGKRVLLISTAKSLDAWEVK